MPSLCKLHDVVSIWLTHSCQEWLSPAVGGLGDSSWVAGASALWSTGTGASAVVSSAGDPPSAPAPAPAVFEQTKCLDESMRAFPAGFA